MSNTEKFTQIIQDGYDVEGKFITLGGGMLAGESVPNTFVNLPLKTMNRHGLIAGSTGSGKTKTLQLISEQLSAQGVPVLLMDIKGDLSGIGAEGSDHPKITERHGKIGIPFQVGKSPVEFLTLSEEKGARLRATVTEFGPILFAKILELNETQSGVLSVIFKYSDDNDLPLLDLKDLKKVLQYAGEEGKEKLEADYGKISTATTGVIMRKIIELEQQGADKFFGERSFEVEDLMRKEGTQGVVNILRLTDIQDKPKLFSTFMLQMLAEVYATLPEAGDMDKPKLVIFIDEAHLMFNEASKALLNQIESIVKLIRSKGVGLYFVTQNPVDVPEAILGQLGMKIQHSLRAFTAKDRKAIKTAAQNYPETEFYDAAQLLTELGIGEALVTVLSEKGTPTPLVRTLLQAPKSRMGVLTSDEIDAILGESKIIEKYNEEIDNESAYEMLSKKIKEAKDDEAEEKVSKKSSKKAAAPKEEKSAIEEAMNSQVGKTVMREVTRGLLGALGIRSTRRRSRKSGWF